MPYSVKVNFGQNLSLEVTGDDVAVVAQLLNETTKSSFQQYLQQRLNFRF